MGLEKIKEEIMQKAASIEKQILAEAASKVKQVDASTNESLMKLESEHAQRLASEIKSLENRENAIANMESKKMLFEAKKQLIDAAYNEAFDRIKSMPRKDRTAFLAKLFDKASKEIDVHVTYANDEDKSMVNRGTIKPLKSMGGIICENKDGTIRVDYTFETLFNDIREKTMKEASKILFEKSEVKSQSAEIKNQLQKLQ